MEGRRAAGAETWKQPEPVPRRGRRCRLASRVVVCAVDRNPSIVGFESLDVTASPSVTSQMPEASCTNALRFV
jgi:hypothetical protein